MKKFTTSQAKGVSSIVTVIVRMLFLVAIFGSVYYMYSWQSNMAASEGNSKGGNDLAGEKETIKQHVIELLDSFTRTHNENQAAVLPSPDYMEALASAVAEKMEPLIASSLSSMQPMQPLSTKSKTLTDCPSCPPCKSQSLTTITEDPTEKQRSSAVNLKGYASVDSSLAVSGLESMQAIGYRTGTDKVRHHGYHRFYPLFLEGLRQRNLGDNTKIKMFEIGYLQGESFKMWKEYFEGADVYFMEKDRQGPDSPHYHEKEGFYGDQGNTDDLQAFLDTKKVEGQLDFIIDDGSHHPQHQITSFKYLFEKGLKPGGVYIIEDTEMNYWLSGETYGLSTRYGKNSPNSLMNMMKELVDVANREYSPMKNRFTSLFGPGVDEWVSGVFFAGNCAVVTKMSLKEKKIFGDRVYRYPDKIEPPKKDVDGKIIDTAAKVKFEV